MMVVMYPPQQEENIYIRQQAQAWRRSGLITEEQLSAINEHTDIQLRRTNMFFRLLFFVFTMPGSKQAAPFSRETRGAEMSGDLLFGGVRFWRATALNRLFSLDFPRTGVNYNRLCHRTCKPPVTLTT